RAGAPGHPSKVSTFRTMVDAGTRPTVDGVMMAKTSTPTPSRPLRSGTPVWLRVLIPLVLAAVWLVVAALGGSSFSQISEVSTNDQSQFLPASSEATQVQDLQAEFRDSDLVPAVLVFHRDGGLTD